MKNRVSKYGGILISIVYGLIMREFFGIGFKNSSDLFSITFVCIVPIFLGLIPILFASSEQLSSFSYRITSPILAVFCFFIATFWLGREDIICIIIMSIFLFWQ